LCRKKAGEVIDQVVGPLDPEQGCIAHGQGVVR
jgi:hypothetical protein